jgi:hypothetical protein
MIDYVRIWREAQRCVGGRRGAAGGAGCQSAADQNNAVRLCRPLTL